LPGPPFLKRIRIPKFSRGFASGHSRKRVWGSLKISNQVFPTAQRPWIRQHLLVSHITEASTWISDGGSEWPVENDRVKKVSDDRRAFGPRESQSAETETTPIKRTHKPLTKRSFSKWKWKQKRKL